MGQGAGSKVASWLRLEATFDSHPKVQELTPADAWRWVRVLLYCARHETDGHVTSTVLRGVSVSKSAQDRFIMLGLLDPYDGGIFIVHDYLTFNPSKADREKERERWREHKRAARVHGGLSRDSSGSPLRSLPLPLPKDQNRSTQTAPRVLSTDERDGGEKSADETGVLEAARALGAGDVGAVLPELGDDGGYGW